VDKRKPYCNRKVDKIKPYCLDKTQIYDYLAFLIYEFISQDPYNNKY
jgi:hypothetical protein